MQEPGQILEVVRFLEQLGRPFLFFIAHGATPNLSLATIEKTLVLAPKTCRGFYVAENTSRYPTAKWDEFVDWAEKVLDLCLRYGGKNLIFKEMYDSWALLPSDPAVRDRLLHPRYRGSVVALYATNDAHAPELQFGGMVGLKQTGLVSDWGVSTQDWNWSWSEQGLAQAYSCLCPADVVLRLELQAACLGARWFHIEGGQEYLRRGAAELALPAFRHRDLFHELIRKRFLPPVADVDNLSFSNLIAVRSPTPGLAAARLNGTCLGSPHERPFESWQQGLFGVRDALVSTVPGYFPAYAYGARRYCDSMFPATPYGFVRMVPDCPEAESLLTGRYVLRTDGIAELIHGARIGADAARSRLQHDLERGLDGQWFLAAGVGVYAHRVGNAYRVWLMDPGYLCPEGVRTVLQVRLPEPSLSVRDLISGQPITGVTRRLPMDVPAGGFRLLEVVPGARP
jgi:hypothetical protein